MAQDMVWFAAFLRAVNVAGHARVTMKDLAAAFSAAGCSGVRTCIQSGNVVFGCEPQALEATCARIAATVGDLLGAEPQIAFRSADEIGRLVRRNPFAAFEADPEIKRYVAFLSSAPQARAVFPIALPREGLEALGMTGRDVFIVSRRKPNGMYGFPNNFLEHQLGAPATTRNWTTVQKVAGMLEQRRSS